MQFLRVQPELRAQRGLRVQRGLQAHKGQLELMGLMELPDHRGQLVLQVQQAPLARLVQLVLMDPMVQLRRLQSGQ